MSDSDYLHGIRVIKGGAEVRIVLTPNQAVVGVVGLAPNAAASLPLETPTVFFNKKDALAAILPNPEIAKTTGQRGTLYGSVSSIFNQGAQTVVIVRARSTSNADIVSAIEKLIEAEALTNYKPKILCAPGHTANIPVLSPSSESPANPVASPLVSEVDPNPSENSSSLLKEAIPQNIADISSNPTTIRAAKSALKV